MSRRLALVALGLLLSLGAVEGLLQLGALVVRLTGHQAAVGWATGKPRMICLGDSNTYGLYVLPGQEYPQQLARLLAAGTRAPAYEILNLGFPGNNSSNIRAALPRVLAELRPDVVTVMIGANDLWTEPLPAAAAASPPDTFADALYRYSRAYRLLVMLARGLRSTQLAVARSEPDGSGTGTATFTYGDTTFTWGWRHSDGSSPDWVALLHENLRSIVAQARAANVDLILLTYPSEQQAYGVANTVVREVAAASGAPLIDLGLAFRDTCAKPPCPQIFYPDNHPTAEGYRLAAEHMLDWLAAHRDGT